MARYTPSRDGCGDPRSTSSGSVAPERRSTWELSRGAPAPVPNRLPSRPHPRGQAGERVGDHRPAPAVDERLGRPGRGVASKLISRDRSIAPGSEPLPYRRPCRMDRHPNERWNGAKRDSRLSDPGEASCGATRLAVRTVRRAGPMRRTARRRLTCIGCGDELEGDRIHTVAGVLGSEPLALEDVAEMRVAARAPDLDTHSVRIAQSLHRPGDLVIEARPAASSVELIVRSIQRSTASFAHICPGLEVVLLLSGERSLGAVMHDHGLFRAGQFAEGGRRLSGHVEADPCRVITPQ